MNKYFSPITTDFINTHQEIEECLTFYKIMDYPIPRHYEYFLYNKKIILKYEIVDNDQ